MAEPHGPQMTVQNDERNAICIPDKQDKATDTHSEYIILTDFLMATVGYANGPQYYVIRPLPLVLRSDKLQLYAKMGCYIQTYKAVCAPYCCTGLT